ncbi:vertnin [Discoglossus pictus]
MASRQEFALTLLEKMQDATDLCSLDGLTSAAVQVETTLSALSLPPACTRNFQGILEIDSIAHRLYPSDAPKNMYPLKYNGPGNHLFEAASILLWGSPALALELQLRTVVEMLLHKDYYLSEMIDSKVMLQAVRYSLSTEDSAPHLQLSMPILQGIYDADVRATCFPGTFSNMWHMYALASVLKANIYSIYPQRNSSIRPYFNRLIHPRNEPFKPPTLHIMWSGQPLPPHGFQPNCFVPVVGLQELHIPSTKQTVPVLNSDSKLTYSPLSQKSPMCDNPAYPWKLQSMNHKSQSAPHFEAKQYFQNQYQKVGNLVPFRSFRQLYPNVSRSTYYAWKYELLQLTEASLFPSPPSTPEGEDDNSSGALSDARSYLERCISLKAVVPYHSFKQSFPTVCRSTYYNWRRKALQEPKLPSCQNTKLTKESRTAKSKLHHQAYTWTAKRQEALRRVQNSGMPYCRFRLRYPGISGSIYSLWRAAATRPKERTVCVTPTTETPTQLNSYNATISGFSVSSSTPEEPFLEIMRTAHLKTEAKLFLQKRFESQNFPSFREFQCSFPSTARSTYYMWKRALHSGLTLVDM